MTRVLLAEDDPLVREALTEMLRGGAVEVVAVETAVDALSAMLDPAAAFDAAVLDLTLGEHTETLHRALARAGVPVLLVSGRDPDALPSHATLHGWSYLAKPVEAAALRDALDRILVTPEPEMPDPASPDTSAVRQRPARVVVAPPIPTAVQLVDKLTSLAAVVVLGYLALHGKLSTESGVLILAAVGVDSIPRGILAARSGGNAPTAGSGGAALGLVGLGLMGALSRSPAPPTATVGPAATQASAIGALVVLVALALGVLGCDPVRQAALDTQSPRVGCVALSHRCHNGAPEVCSAAGRWWASLPRSPSGEPRRCADVCEVVDGVAGCRSSAVVTP